MTQALQIGITGGIGTGKSTVCKIFSILEIPVYEADTRARWLMNNDRELKDEISRQFGKEAYTQDGELNRAYLAAQVFNESDKVKLLNSLVHPRLGKDYLQWVQKEKEAPYLLNEAALMFEAGRYQMMDKVIVVTAPLELRIARVLQRDPQRSREEVLAIIAKQMPEEEKITRADYLIHNNEQQMLIPQVLKLHRVFLDGKINLAKNKGS